MCYGCLFAGPHPWWAVAMAIGGTVLLIAVLTGVFLKLTDRW